MAERAAVNRLMKVRFLSGTLYPDRVPRGPESFFPRAGPARFLYGGINADIFRFSSFSFTSGSVILYTRRKPARRRKRTGRTAGMKNGLSGGVSVISAAGLCPAGPAFVLTAVFGGPGWAFPADAGCVAPGSLLSLIRIRVRKTRK